VSSARREEEALKGRKLAILFGPWWRHYAVPYEFRWMLYTERNACPYCGGALGPFAAERFELEGAQPTAQLDHMDPLVRGGADSLCNALYVCAGCNQAKGRRLFVDWLARLPAEFAAQAAALYTTLHGYAPEAFTPGSRQPRLALPRLELRLDESVLRHLFPHPIVQGPPRRQAGSTPQTDHAEAAIASLKSHS
jgi:hypothetical protein